MNEPRVQTATIDGVYLKYAIPDRVLPNPIILMLHGWTGDENSMWIFASKMPENALLIAPRGMFPSALGGYGWYEDNIGGLPKLDNFRLAIDRMHSILRSDLFFMGDTSNIKMVGFSQGAALAFSFALLQVNQLSAIAGLSGFVPEGVDDYVLKKPLEGMPIFAAHGIQDHIVPVERARHGVEILKKAGAQVTYCEDDVGHKLSASCYRGMKEFLAR